MTDTVSKPAPVVTRRSLVCRVTATLSLDDHREVAKVMRAALAAVAPLAARNPASIPMGSLLFDLTDDDDAEAVSKLAADVNRLVPITGHAILTHA